MKKAILTYFHLTSSAYYCMEEVYMFCLWNSPKSHIYLFIYLSECNEHYQNNILKTFKLSNDKIFNLKGNLLFSIKYPHGKPVQGLWVLKKNENILDSFKTKEKW